MTSMLVVTLVALAAAALVLLVASVSSGEKQAGPTFLTDLRAGIAARRHPDAEQVAAAAAAHAEPVDVPLDDLLLATSVDDDGYLRADEVRDAIFLARDKAVHSMHELGRRSA